MQNQEVENGWNGEIDFRRDPAIIQKSHDPPYDSTEDGVLLHLASTFPGGIGVPESMDSFVPNHCSGG